MKNDWKEEFERLYQKKIFQTDNHPILVRDEIGRYIETQIIEKLIDTIPDEYQAVAKGEGISDEFSLEPLKQQLRAEWLSK